MYSGALCDVSSVSCLILNLKASVRIMKPYRQRLSDADRSNLIGGLVLDGAATSGH